MATLTVTATTDYAGQTLANIDSIVFANVAAATAFFGANQFGAGLISNTVAITGNAAVDRITVDLAAAGSFSAGGWSFSGWDASDLVTLNGTGGTDTITGSTQNDSISGGNGADTLSGDAGDDSFSALSGQIAAGESIDGGADLDTLILIGNHDLRFAAIAGVETLTLAGSVMNVTLSGSQIGAGGFTFVSGDVASRQALSIFGSSVDLSGVAFTGWGGPLQQIIISGTTGIDAIVGSALRDQIVASLGGDTLEGRDGDDAFLIQNAGDLAAFDTLDGGAGADLLLLSRDGSYDATATTLVGIERLSSNFDTSIRFAGNQIGGSAITAIFGNAARTQSLIVDGDNVDLSALTFSGWTGGSQTITINGTGAIANTLVGSIQADSVNGQIAAANTITGGRGADLLTGGNADDRFRYLAPSELVAGETIAGNAGTDTLELVNAGTLDFGLAGVTLTGIERIDFVSGNTTAKFRSVIGAVDGGTGLDALVVTGTSVNLSAVTFTNWTVGADTVTVNGTAGADNLFGSTQNDTIVGGADADATRGGLGNDVFVYNAATDIAAGEQVLGDQGADVLRIAGLDGFDFTPVSFFAVEGVQFASSATVLFGSDQFQAGRLSTSLAVTGSSGQNLLLVNLSAAGAFSAAGWTFGTWGAEDHVVISGTGGDDSLTGSVQADGLDGGGGADTLAGRAANDVIGGGTGADTMFGEAGNDRFVYEAPDDIAAGEAVNGGADVDTLDVAGLGIFDFIPVTFAGIEALKLGADMTAIFSSLQFVGTTRLSNALAISGSADGADIVEVRLNFGAASFSAAGWTFAGWGADDIVRLVGSFGANTITGSSKSDAIVDGGGAGIDTMIGGLGDDSYTIDSTSDVVTESAGAGVDTVLTTASYALPDNVENLTLAFESGPLNGAGNGLNNTIVGGLADNLLDGAAGADTMQGNGGNDTYVVDNAADKVIEAGGAGIDLVQSSVSFSLNGQFADDLTLTGSAFSATGNALANTLTGNAADNRLDGLLGPDTLTGSGGNDAFVFDTGLGPLNVDQITDFDVDIPAVADSHDVIQLQNALFTLLATPGILAAGSFASVADEADSDNGSTITYVSGTGNVYYDINGSANGGAIRFAVLSAGLALTNADFEVI